MSDDENISQESKTLLEALKKMKIETVSDFEHFLQKEKEKSASTSNVKETKEATKYPRISLFFGETGKGEVSYRTWRYEVNCLLRERAYSNESMLLGIRRSLRGEAADMVMRLGETAKIGDILETFQSAFGNTETVHTILKKLHACEQQPDESVIKFAARVEEMFSQAVDLGAVNRSQQALLKSIFYEGLNFDLKTGTSFKYETISDYNEFKSIVRKLESEMQQARGKQEPKGKTSCNATSEKEETVKPSKIDALLEKMNQVIEKLEQDKTNTTQNQQQVSSGATGQVWRRDRGPRHFRGRGRGEFNNRPYRGFGKGDAPFSQRRPTASKTFRPANLRCYQCDELGHFARDCPLNK